MLPLSMIWGYRCCLFLRYGGIDVASFYDMGVSMLPLSTIWGNRCCLFLRYGGIDVASFYDMEVSMLPLSMILYVPSFYDMGVSNDMGEMLPLCTIMIHLYDFWHCSNSVVCFIHFIATTESSHFFLSHFI